MLTSPYADRLEVEELWFAAFETATETAFAIYFPPSVNQVEDIK